jgi:hypothetical protein
MRETVPSSPLATQTAFGLTATPAGPPPTVIVCRTWFVSGSILETVFPPVFVTQIARASAATPPGATPTGISAAISSLSWSMTPTAFALTEASAVDPPPWVKSTPTVTPTTAAANVAPISARRPGRRQGLAISSAAASANSPSRPSKGVEDMVLSGGKSISRPGAVSW